MAQLGRLTDRPRRLTADAVVRPLSRVAQRPCARPACPAPSRATLSFDYRLREAWIDPLVDEPDPGSYDLCLQHVARTRAPHGWRLRDRRTPDEQASDTPPVRPADFGSERTVAVLAAVLRSVPSPAPESGGTGRRSEIARDDAGGHAPGGGPVQRSATGVAPAVALPASAATQDSTTRATGLASIVALHPSDTDEGFEAADSRRLATVAELAALPVREAAPTPGQVRDRRSSPRTAGSPVFATNW